MGGSNLLPLTFVDNCAEAIVLAGLRPGIEGEIFNVVDDELLTSSEFLRLYKKGVNQSFSVQNSLFPCPSFVPPMGEILQMVQGSTSSSFQSSSVFCRVERYPFFQPEASSALGMGAEGQHETDLSFPGKCAETFFTLPECGGVLFAPT